MKKIIFLSILVWVSENVTGMNENLNSQEIRNNSIRKQKIGEKICEVIEPSAAPNVGGGSKSDNNALRNSNVDVSSMQVDQTYFSPNWLASFHSEEPQDVANLLLSIGNMMQKQNFMYRTNLEEVKNQAIIQGEWEAYRRYQEALKIRDDQSQQLAKYYQEKHSKLLQKESEYQKQLQKKEEEIQKNNSLLQRTLQEFQNFKSQYQQELIQKLKQQESEYQKQLQQKEEELKQKDSSFQQLQKKIQYQQEMIQKLEQAFQKRQEELIKQKEDELKQKDICFQQLQKKIQCQEEMIQKLEEAFQKRQEELLKYNNQQKQEENKSENKNFKNHSPKKRTSSSPDPSKSEKKHKIDNTEENHSTDDNPAEKSTQSVINKNNTSEARHGYDLRKKSPEVMIIELDSDTEQPSNNSTQPAKNRNLVKVKTEETHKDKSEKNSNPRSEETIKNAVTEDETHQKIRRIVLSMRDVLAKEQSVSDEQFSEMENQIYRDYDINQKKYKHYWRYVRDWNNLSDLRKKVVKTIVSLKNSDVESDINTKGLIDLGNEQKPNNRAVDWISNHLFRAVVRMMIGKESPQIISRQESLSLSSYRHARYMSRIWSILARAETTS